MLNAPYATFVTGLFGLFADPSPPSCLSSDPPFGGGGPPGLEPVLAFTGGMYMYMVSTL